jgi:hypothetical protein
MLLELVNLSLEVSDVIVSIHELNLMLLQLLLALLQVLNLLGPGRLEILKLLGLRDGGLLCLTQDAAVPE